MPVFPSRMCVTEAWAPNAERARALLGSRDVEVVPVRKDEPLPLPGETFDGRWLGCRPELCGIGGRVDQTDRNPGHQPRGRQDA